MKRHHRLRSAHERTDKGQTEEPSAQHSSDMKVDDVVIQSQQKLNQASGRFGIVDLVGIRLSVPRNVDDRAGHAVTAEKSADCHQVALHSAMRRRVRT